MEANKQQTFSFETVAVLVAAIFAGGGTLGEKEFVRMSALDGTKGKDAFSHMFRKVKVRAKEINETAGDDLTPVKKTRTPSKKTSTDAKEASAGKVTKRVRKTKKDEDADEDEDVGSAPKKIKTKKEGAGNGAGDGGSALKIVKAEPKDEEADLADAPGEKNAEMTEAEREADIWKGIDFEASHLP